MQVLFITSSGALLLLDLQHRWRSGTQCCVSNLLFAAFQPAHTVRQEPSTFPVYVSHHSLNAPAITVKLRFLWHITIPERFAPAFFPLRHLVYQTAR